MLRHKGTPHCVTGPILCVVATAPTMGRYYRPTALVAENHSGRRDGHVAIVCKSNGEMESRTALPFIRGVSTAGDLKDGDVVRIEPDGGIAVLYEAGSRDNVLFLTGRCNARCLMCPQPPSYGDDYRPGEVTEFVRLIRRDTEAIGITGGEPTLVRGILVEAVLACKRYLQNAELTILTNGILLSDFDYVKEIVSVGHPNAVFGIPLCSDTSSGHNEIIGMEGFYSTLKGIHNLALIRQKVEVRIVILRKNVDRLPQIAEFVYRNLPFAYHVAFIGLEMMHNARRYAEDVWVDPATYGEELMTAIRTLHRGAMNVSIYNHPLCILPRPLWRFARVSISNWKRSYGAYCSNCLVRTSCGGLFSTSGEWQSSSISPILESV